jgi:hypothetical protein
LRLHAPERLDAGRPRGLPQQPDDEIELDREPGAALQREAVEKTRLRIKVLQPLDVAMDDDVLPGNERVVENEYRVVLVEA